MSAPDNFFSSYFEYTSMDFGEAPVNAHRWAAIGMVGALLGKQLYLPFGHSAITPNQYIQLIGVPATKKSTAIKISNALLKLWGYDNFAPQKLSMSQFLLELHEKTWGSDSEEEEQTTDLEENLFGSVNMKERAKDMPVAELYVASDEFVDFIGRNNLDFISLLGTFWDYKGVYDYKLKNSKPVIINEPTINIIAGNTPTGFNAAFPAEIQGQGFFSRMLLINTKPSGRKVAWPKAAPEESVSKMLDYLTKIKTLCIGEVTLHPEAYTLIEQIYYTWQPIPDHRFEHYTGRRHTHLLKLAIICAAMRVATHIIPEDVLLANTILTFAEYEMPDAMGEFGKGRNSAVAHKILEILNKSEKPLTISDIIKHVHSDVDNLSAITDIVRGLQMADKIQIVDGAFLPKKLIRTFRDTDLIKPSWLLPEERLSM